MIHAGDHQIAVGILQNIDSGGIIRGCGLDLLYGQLQAQILILTLHTGQQTFAGIISGGDHAHLGGTQANTVCRRSHSTGQQDTSLSAINRLYGIDHSIVASGAFLIQIINTGGGIDHGNALFLQVVQRSANSVSTEVAHDSKHTVGFHQLLGVGHALCTVKAVVIVLEHNALALEATSIVISLEGGLHAGVEGNAHCGVGTGGSSSITNKDLRVAYTLHINKGGILALVGRCTLAAAAGQRDT